jgi:anti-repressor protein
MTLQIEQDKPKVDFHSTLFTENRKCSMNEFSKLLSEAHNIKIGHNKIMAFLREGGYLMKGRDKNERNMPYQKFVIMKYFEVEYRETHIGQIPQTMILPQGQLKLSDMIVNHFMIK